jgi:RNA polymerase sigma-70 factor (ECF subfamily)
MSRGRPRVGWSELERRIRAHLERGELGAAASQAVEALRPSMRSFLHTMLAEEDADDALSLFEESLWRTLPAFRWECSLRAWAYRLAHGAKNRVLRQPHRRREQRLPSSAASRLAAPSRASGGVSSGRHTGLESLRAQLRSHDQELLTLRYDQLEWEEIGVALGSSSVAVRKRYERLTRRLERMARDAGLVD